MRLGLQDTNWGYIGAKLAQADSSAQIEFFKSFVKECKSWGTNFQIERQLLTINQNLTNDEKQALSMLSFTE